MHRAQQVGAVTDLDPGRLQYLERAQPGLAHVAEFGEADLRKAKLPAEAAHGIEGH